MVSETPEGQPGEDRADSRELATLRASGLFDPTPDPDFDRWTDFVRTILDCDVALITLLDRDRQFFKSASGLQGPWASRRETPLSHSFCKYVVSRGQAVETPDAREEQELAGSRAVSELGVVAYLGVPLRVDGDRVLGALAAIHRSPRKWSDRDRELLGDVAAAVESEIELQVLRRRTRAVMTNLTDVISVFDETGKLRYVSPSIAHILGHDPEEPLGASIEDLVHPDDRKVLSGAVEKVRAEPERTVSATVRAIHADGRERLLEARLTNLLEDPVVHGILAVTRDVTERIQAEGKLSLFLAHAPIAVWTVDRDLAFTWVAGRAVEDMGLDPGDLVGKTIFDIFDTDDPGFPPITAYRRALKGEPGQFDVEWSDHWWEVRLAPVIENGGVKGIAGVALDVTDRRAMARRLEERTAHFQGLFEEAPEAIVIVDREDRILQVNPEFQRLFGYSPEEAVGRHINELIVVPGLEDEALGITERVAEGERVEVETVRQRNDGSAVEVSILATPVQVGEEKRVYGIYRDITERKELEARLLHSQRLEAVGRLAGGVAHDFNNILTVILGQTEALLERHRDDEDLREELEEIAAAGGRGVRLTRQLLTFSRRDAARPRPIDVSATVRDARNLLERVIEESVELSFDLEDSLPSVKLDPGQLEQVVMNLVINARDAMEAGGRVKIRTTLDTRPGEDRLLAREDTSPWVVLEVHDQGRGMTAEEKARMFEPFYTTKKTGQGTGLGLSTVYGIVERAGGHIDVETSPGEGTAVKILLPIVQERAEATTVPDAAPPEPAPSGTGHLVLLVDDDRAVRTVAERILERNGYRVVAAESGEAALARCDELEEAPDAVVSDLVMPGINGYELIERLRERYPEIAFILMTGYAEPESGYEDLDVEPLAKPFDASTLLRTLRERLAESG